MKSSVSAYAYRGKMAGAAARRRGGFTLLELMVVLIIITLLSTMVVPSAVSALRRNTVRTEGEKLTELLRFASVSAISRHKPVQVNIDSRRRLCWVSLSDAALPWMEERQEARTQTLATLPLREDLQVTVTFVEGNPPAGEPSEGWQVITFRSDGRADNAVLALTNPGGDIYEVEVFGASGEVIVHENET